MRPYSTCNVLVCVRCALRFALFFTRVLMISELYELCDLSFTTALVSALKTLQEKISRLELDKFKAQNCLTSLSVENNEHKKALSEKEKSEAAQREAARQKNGNNGNPSTCALFRISV